MRINFSDKTLDETKQQYYEKVNDKTSKEILKIAPITKQINMLAAGKKLPNRIKELVDYSNVINESILSADSVKTIYDIFKDFENTIET